MSLEGRFLGDHSVAEAFAFLFERLASDPGWLERYLGTEKPAPYVQFACAHKLSRLRRMAARFRYEVELYSDGDLANAPDAYRVALSEACLSMYPRALFLFDLSSHLYSARYLRGWILEGILHRHMVHYFEEDWHRNPRAGAFLRKLWRKGQETDGERLANQLGHTALDPQPLVEDFERQL